MKFNNDIFFLLLMFFFVLSVYQVNASITDFRTQTNLSPCSTPTSSLFIGVIAGQTKYNVSSVTVAKNTCYHITLVNSDTIVHTLTIGDTIDPGNTSYFNLYAISGSSMGTNYLTPNVDKIYKFYCSIPGHDATMYGNFTVGSGGTSTSHSQNFSTTTIQNNSVPYITSASGFDLLTTLFLLIPISLIFSSKRKK